MDEQVQSEPVAEVPTPEVAPEPTPEVVPEPTPEVVPEPVAALDEPSMPVSHEVERRSFGRASADQPVVLTVIQGGL